MTEYDFTGGLQAGRKTLGRTLFVLLFLGILAVIWLVFCQPAFAADFADTRGHWAEQEIDQAVERGYVKGFPNGTFQPNRGITRAEFITMVNGAFKIKGNPGDGASFSDVDAGDWFASAVQAASGNGYVKGYPDGTFRPLKQINRQEAASLLMGVLKVDEKATLRFTDNSQIGAWARPAVAGLVAKGVISGLPDGSFRPLRTITRAEAVAMINRGLEVQVKPEQPVEPEPEQPEEPDEQKQPEIAPVKLYLVVTGSVVNVRLGPGVDYDLLGQVRDGDLLKASAHSENNWYLVEFQGKKGWISGDYVETHTERPPRRGDPGSLEVNAVSQSGRVLITLAGGSDTEYSWEEQDGCLVVDVPGVTVVRTPLEIKVGKAGVERVVTKFSEDKPGFAQVEVHFDGEQSSPYYLVKEGTPGELQVTVPNLIKDIDLSVDGETVVLEISGSADISYKSFTLRNPQRIIFDFNGFALEPSLRDWSKRIDLDGFGMARLGQFQTDVVRLVVEADRRLAYTAEKAKGGKELTLLLQAKGAAGSCVVIDPGHGGSDPGAVGPSGLKEKDVNLDIAWKVTEILRQQGVEVILTREDDYDVGLLPRAQLANDWGATAFVSIHSNASTNRSVGGTSTYTYVPSGQQRDERLYLAQLLQEEMVGALWLRDIGVLQENFSVLRNTWMPAALCEVAFISNPDEEQLLASDDFRQRAAEAIARGITRFLAG